MNELIGGQDKEIKLIGNGAYGCIFHPGIKCRKNEKTNNANFVTKIQYRDFSLNNEIEIGAIIKKKIPGYKFYFAPIIESCNVNLSTVNEKTIEKCDLGITNKTSSQFLSSKISYVGSDSLRDYLYKKLYSQLNNYKQIRNGAHLQTQRITNIKLFIVNILETHIYILESIQMLNNINIIHFDLKENNILYDYKNKTPIVIDFGSSLQLDKIITPAQYKTSMGRFSREYVTYPYWSIESVLFIYICKYIISSTDTSFSKLAAKITENDARNLKNTLKQFLYEDKSKSNRLTGIPANQSKRFEATAVHFVNGFIGKSWKSLWDVLYVTNKTWDNYSIAQIFHIELYILGVLDEYAVEFSFMKSYVDLLRNLLMAPPTKRKTIPDTIKELENLLSRVKKSDVNSAVKNTKNVMLKQQYLEKTKTTVNTFNFLELQKQAALKNK